MQFRFAEQKSLPRLSWLAEVTRGQAQVRVHHGPWVETRDDRFFEAAWDGDFSTGDFDKAETMVGTGALIREGRLIFAPPTNLFVWIASLKIEDRLFLSNSLTFLLAHTGDRPSLNKPFYYRDTLMARRWGLHRKPVHLPTDRGRTVTLNYWDNVYVRPDLSLEKVARPRPRPFRNFQAFSDHLHSTLQAVFDNAGHPQRRYSFRPISTISQGYDSAAIAAVARAAGCREAITYVGKPEGPQQLTDSGEAVGAQLGMRVSAYDRAESSRIPASKIAEFCATPSRGTGFMLSMAETQLEGSILCIGRTADAFWSLDERFNTADLVSAPVRSTTSTSYLEYRLRVGYLSFGVPFIGAVHRPALQAIAESDEMKSWSIGGGYDRPIQRRILEQAGVSRESFGQQKMASLHIRDYERQGGRLPEFEAFFAELDVPAWARNNRKPLSEFRFLPLDLLYGLSSRLPDKRKRVYKWLLPLTLRSDRWAWSSSRLSKLYYLFHWGFEEIKDRYEIAELFSE
jgi:hypothetical protein